MMETVTQVSIPVPPVDHYTVFDMEDALNGLKGYLDLLFSASNGEDKVSSLQQYLLLSPLVQRMENVLTDLINQS